MSIEEERNQRRERAVELAKLIFQGQSSLKRWELEFDEIIEAIKQERTEAEAPEPKVIPMPQAQAFPAPLPTQPDPKPGQPAGAAINDLLSMIETNRQKKKAPPAPLTIEDEVMGLREPARGRVRVMLQHRGKWTRLEKEQGWPAATCSNLVSKVLDRYGDDSPLLRTLEINRGRVEGGEACARCGLHGHAAGDRDRCLPSIDEFAGSRRQA